MNKIILSTVVAMLMGGSAYAGDVIAPPVTKYVQAPVPPKDRKSTRLNSSH